MDVGPKPCGANEDKKDKKDKVTSQRSIRMGSRRLKGGPRVDAIHFAIAQCNALTRVTQRPPSGCVPIINWL